MIVLFYFRNHAMVGGGLRCGRVGAGPRCGVLLVIVGLWYMLIIGLNSKITDEFYISKKIVLLYALFSGYSPLPPVENLKFNIGILSETSNAIPWVCDLESF